MDIEKENTGKIVSDFETILMKKLDAVALASAVLPAIDQMIKVLDSNVSSLNELVGIRSFQLQGMHNDGLLLLQENKLSKEQTSTLYIV